MFRGNKKKPFVTLYLECAKATNLHDDESFKKLEKTVLTIVDMVGVSASELGIKDNTKIENITKILLAVIDPDLFTRDILSLSFQFHHLAIFERILKNADTNHLLAALFQCESPTEAIYNMLQLGKLEKNIDILSDWMWINTLLSDNELFYTYMDKLEQELQHYVGALSGDWQFPTREDGKFVLPTSPNTEAEHCCYKVLSNYFYQWAQENGFESRAIILRRVKAGPFHSMLSAASFFKDNFGIDHGIWAHMQQWYAIMEHQKKTKFLKHPPIDLYKAMGDTTRLSEGDDSILFPWSLLLDRGNNDCRTPEFITSTTKDNSLRWPLLSGSIARRYNKHESKIIEHYAKLSAKHKKTHKENIVTIPFVRSKL